MTDPAAFRAEFPVLERSVYLNAGTEGPVPWRAHAAAQARLERETQQPRSGKDYLQATLDAAEGLRDAYASLLGCSAEHVALTGSTTDGINTVLSGLDLRPGDEILTSDEEHPGLLAPLGRLRRRSRVVVRVVPFDRMAESVGSATRLIATSHVSWVGGKVADVDGLAATGVPVLLDAAQGIGAVPARVEEMGIDFYAASGQKWLCGPEGSGCLYVRPDRLDDLLVPWPGYGSVAVAERALELEAKPGAARFDHGFPPGIRSVWAKAALDVFADAGWEWMWQRAASLADSLARALSEKGLNVAPRGRSTLVSWKAADPAAVVERLSELGVVVRSIPSGSLVRASVGAWSSEEDLERLVSAAAGADQSRTR